MNAEDCKRLEEIKLSPDFGTLRYPDKSEPSKAFEQANIMRDWLIAHLEAAERRGVEIGRRLEEAVKKAYDRFQLIQSAEDRGFGMDYIRGCAKAGAEEAIAALKGVEE